MSESTLQDGDVRVTPAAGADETQDGFDPVAVHRSVMTPVAAIGFWSAIVLPFLYVPMLFSAVTVPNEFVVFLGLLGLHLVALALGRSYRPA